jgi:PAS domain S-box-containing protein
VIALVERIDRLSGSEDLADMVHWLAQRCGALGARLTITQPDKPPDTLATWAAPEDATHTREHVIDLGVVRGAAAALQLKIAAQRLPPEVSAQRDALAAILRLVIDRHLARQAEADATRRAQEEARQRDQMFNAIETLPDGVLVWDNAERLVFANSAYGRMYPEVAAVLVPGVSQAEMMQIAIRTQSFPESIGREEDWLAEEWHRYKNPTIDEVVRFDKRWIRRVDLRTSDGGRIAVRIDTTERHRQMEELDAANVSLAKARESLAQIIERADLGTWDWDVETGSLRIGGRYAQLLGYTPEELGAPSDDLFRSLVHPDDMARLDQTEDDDYALLPDGSETVREHQLRMRRKDGGWAWILSRSAVTERLPDGRHKSVVGIHLDVTSRKDLEDLVVSNQTFLTKVMDTSISALVVLNSRGIITYANAEAERILGAPRSEIEGRSFVAADWNISDPDGAPMATGDLPFLRAMREKTVMRDIRMSIGLPDGSRRILSVNAVPHEADTTTAGDNLVIASFMDITDSLTNTARLEQALLQAQAASQAKSTFLANMSHEIRTPLNGVLGMAELLDGLINDPRKKQMIRTIRTSGELLLNVLNEVLDMSKIEAGKMVIETLPLVPAEVARQVEPLHSLRAEEKGLALEFLITPGAEAMRMGDPFRLAQILNNLLSNAIKFTEAGSVVLTMTAHEGRALTIEVRDTGIGMSEEQVSRIFNNFEQAEGGTTRRFGGTGLGMAIVRSLVTLMGGTISVTSAPDKGTRVNVSLPLPEATGSTGPLPDTGPHPLGDRLDAARSAVPFRAGPWRPGTGPGSGRPDSLADPLPRLTGLVLLVADDSATNRMVISEMLKGTEAQIVLATNGAEAVAEWTRRREAGQPVDILILDIAMPVLDGMGALRAIRNAQTGPPIPAIAVTANAMAHQVAEYLDAGFDGHVPKPFRRADLLQAISRLAQVQPLA